ncbi:MAG: (2Fe-2S)-binding protein [Caldisericia bacterium]
MKRININFILNGVEMSDEVPVNITLLEYLRDYLKLTGTKEGCSKGECGACTVIIDGKTYNSCLILIPEINNKEILTIEGLSKDDLTILQKSLMEEGAFQCGFCASGIVMSLTNFLSKNKNPKVDEIRESISGNLCRCTGYKKIIDAVKNYVNMVSDTKLT